MAMNVNLGPLAGFSAVADLLADAAQAVTAPQAAAMLNHMAYPGVGSAVGAKLAGAACLASGVGAPLVPVCVAGGVFAGTYIGEGIAELFDGELDAATQARQGTTMVVAHTLAKAVPGLKFIANPLVRDTVAAAVSVAWGRVGDAFAEGLSGGSLHDAMARLVDWKAALVDTGMVVTHGVVGAMLHAAPPKPSATTPPAHPPSNPSSNSWGLDPDSHDMSGAVTASGVRHDASPSQRRLEALRNGEAAPHAAARANITSKPPGDAPSDAPSKAPANAASSPAATKLAEIKQRQTDLPAEVARLREELTRPFDSPQAKEEAKQQLKAAESKIRSDRSQARKIESRALLAGEPAVLQRELSQWAAARDDLEARLANSTRGEGVLRRAWRAGLDQARAKVAYLEQRLATPDQPHLLPPAPVAATGLVQRNLLDAARTRYLQLLDAVLPESQAWRIEHNIKQIRKQENELDKIARKSEPGHVPLTGTQKLSFAVIAEKLCDFSERAAELREARWRTKPGSPQDLVLADRQRKLYDHQKQIESRQRGLLAEPLTKETAEQIERQVQHLTWVNEVLLARHAKSKDGILRRAIDMVTTKNLEEVSALQARLAPGIGSEQLRPALQGGSLPREQAIEKRLEDLRRRFIELDEQCKARPSDKEAALRRKLNRQQIADEEAALDRRPGEQHGPVVAELLLKKQMLVQEIAASRSDPDKTTLLKAELSDVLYRLRTIRNKLSPDLREEFFGAQQPADVAPRVRKEIDPQTAEANRQEHFQGKRTPEEVEELITRLLAERTNRLEALVDASRKLEDDYTLAARLWTIKSNVLRSIEKVYDTDCSEAIKDKVWLYAYKLKSLLQELETNIERAHQATDPRID